MLFSLSANAGTFSNIKTKDFTPKSEISDVKKPKKINGIQKFIIKKTLKKLQKQALNPQKSKGDGVTRLAIITLTIGSLLLLGGIGFIIAGSTLLGIILAIVGLLILGSLAFFIFLLSNAFRH